MTSKNSVLSGLMCNNPKFQAYLGVTNAEDAAMHVRRTCGVLSRRDLDRDEEAAKRFHELRKAFVYGDSNG